MANQCQKETKSVIAVKNECYLCTFNTQDQAAREPFICWTVAGMA